MDYSNCVSVKTNKTAQKLAGLVVVKASAPHQPQAGRLLLFNGFMPSN